jgi:threonylcarbamoyladenosine tRNA methylthiotransferase MtaB
VESPHRIAYHTLGCKLNFSETSAIARKMEAKGFATVDFEDVADAYVINTCSVTDNADKQCRHMVRRPMRRAPYAYVVVIGCYAQLKPNEIAAIPGVDLVVGAGDKFRLPEILSDLSKNPCGVVMSSDIRAVNSFHDAFSVGDRTRSFLKVQDGCDYKCTFCTIPLARGQSRSDTPENVIRNAEMLAEKGVKEIVLTGVNTGDYGKGLEEEIDFIGLIQRLDRVAGIERFRISSIEPNLLTDDIIQFVANSEKFVPHFHIPLQSGSDKILGLMRRRYQSDLYASRVSAIRAIMPDACIGVDVIVGFPGETEADFLETCHFLHGLDISYLHVFTYSERSNTAAIEMPGKVPQQARDERNAQLRSLSEKKRREFYSRFEGHERPVLWETENRGGLMYGFTDNYIRVAIPYDEGMVNQIVPTILLEEEQGMMMGLLMVVS